MSQNIKWEQKGLHKSQLPKPIVLCIKHDRRYTGRIMVKEYYETRYTVISLPASSVSLTPPGHSFPRPVSVVAWLCSSTPLRRPFWRSPPAAGGVPRFFCGERGGLSLVEAWPPPPPPAWPPWRSFSFFCSLSRVLQDLSSRNNGRPCAGWVSGETGNTHSLLAYVKGTQGCNIYAIST